VETLSGAEMAAIIALLGTIAAALIGGIFALARSLGRNSVTNGSLSRFMEGRERLIERMLDELKVNSQAVISAAQTLNRLHEDMQDALREGRETHAKQTEALTRLLERRP